MANQHALGQYSDALKKRYQQILDQKAKSLTAATLVWDSPSVSATGKKQKSVMIAYSQTRRNEGFWRDLSAIVVLYIIKIKQTFLPALCPQNSIPLSKDECKLSVTNRFAEEFANGTLIYTFYVTDASDADIQNFLFKYLFFCVFFVFLLENDEKWHFSYVFSQSLKNWR